MGDEEWLPRFENQAKRIACLFFVRTDEKYRFLWEMIARELQLTYDETKLGTKAEPMGPEG